MTPSEIQSMGSGFFPFKKTASTCTKEATIATVVAVRIGACATSNAPGRNAFKASAHACGFAPANLNDAKNKMTGKRSNSSFRMG